MLWFSHKSRWSTPLLLLLLLSVIALGAQAQLQPLRRGQPASTIRSRSSTSTHLHRRWEDDSDWPEFQRLKQSAGRKTEGRWSKLWTVIRGKSSKTNKATGQAARTGQTLNEGAHEAVAASSNEVGGKQVASALETSLEDVRFRR